ncbi:PAP1-domain-containing protein [Sporormia fimetaria CBS 119925]|uniref:PAP1-domain-containing protein n=1 Tax=Sporormia fimetaria CBS 119925 TaxID=1340428 RepID=A0A6A6V412_9PLEO|nr:PAP1-domain-containing protein [Sporormia fimetaria CBS 119925]
MASGFQDGAPFYLDPNQQDLLLAALSSNQQDPNAVFANFDTKGPLDNAHLSYPVDASFDPTFFASPHQSTPSNAFGSVEESPFIDYLDGDNAYDFDGNAQDIMIGALPGDEVQTKSGEEGTEKRKNPGGDSQDREGGGKRREGEDKQAKKPGRKPLTERKEKHLRDLETKVSELEKASDAANQENGVLRAQVQRLQMELREYRKRLSLNSAGVNRPVSYTGGFTGLLGNGAANNFQFDFPKFGGLPGSHVFDNGPLAKTTNQSGSISSASSVRHNSASRSSPGSHASSSNVNSPDSIGAPLPVNNAQRPGSLANSHRASVGSNTDSGVSQPRRFQFNSGSSTHSDSPSASSTSNVGQNSSCETSPEPSHNSPLNPADSAPDGYVCHGNSEGEITFCEKLNMACGNLRNPIPRAMSQSDKSAPAAPAKPSATPSQGIDYFANQNNGQFDPQLFGDYRESQAAIVGDGDFTGGFFNDAFPLADFGSPFHFGDTPAVQKPNPIEEIERLQDGEDEVVPGEDPSQMLNCHKIWDKLSTRHDFKDGTIDIDNLCHELRAKARCSESGVVVDTKDVDAALQRFPTPK